GETLAEICEHALEHGCAIDRPAHHALLGGARKFEQSVDEPPHARDTTHDEAEKLATVCIELVVIAPLEQVGKINYRAQRFLQIVRRYVRDFFEFRIDA